MAGKYKVSFQRTGSAPTPHGLSVSKVQFRVSWNGTELGRGECTKPALEKEAIRLITGIWKDKRNEFTPSLPAPTNGLLELREEPYERLDGQEKTLRTALNTPRKDIDGSDGIKRR